MRNIHLELRIAISIAAHFLYVAGFYFSLLALLTYESAFDHKRTAALLQGF